MLKEQENVKYINSRVADTQDIMESQWNIFN